MSVKTGTVRILRRVLEPTLKDTAVGWWLRKFPGGLFWTLETVGFLPVLRRLVSDEKYLRFLTFINPFSAQSPGRLFHEKMMARFRDREGGKVLIIGFNQGTIHYTYFYSPNRNPVYLIDVKETSLRFQGRGKGIHGSIAQPGSLPDEKFALVDFNGVYGAGVNTSADLSQSLDAIHQVLVPGGILLFGQSAVNDPLDLMKTYRRHFLGFDEVVDRDLPYVHGYQVRRVFRKTGARVARSPTATAAEA